MKRRTAVHSGEKPYECDTCGVGFSKKRNLNLHCRRKHGKSTSSDGVPTAKNYKCLICGKLWWSPWALERHKRSHTGEKPFQCDRCGKAFSMKSTLEQHTTVHTGEKPYECGTCGLHFSYKANLKRHCLRKHRKSTSADRVPTVKNQKCLICGKLWSSPSSLKRHMTVHTGEMPYKCGTCGLQFSYNASLKQHCLRNHGKRTSSDGVPTAASDEQAAKYQTCSICGKLWVSPSMLKRHMTSHTGKKPFKCDRCGKAFSMKSTLEQHTTVHTGEKPYECGTCGLHFSYKANLKRHCLRNHGKRASSDGVPTETAVHRKSTSSAAAAAERKPQPDRVPSPRKGLMRRCKEQHGASSHGDAATKPQPQSLAAEQDRTCPICGMVFDSPSRMKRHMVQHTGEKPYQCSICVEYFSQAAALGEHHQKMHKTGKERIPSKDRTCKFCNVLFATISELVQYSQDECTPLPYGVSIKQEEKEGQCSCSTSS